MAIDTSNTFASGQKGGGRQDLAGVRFGRLEALRPTQRVLSSGRKMPAWVLRCDCGEEITAMTVNLSKGKHRSCGKSCPAVAEARIGTRLADKPEYAVHRQMVQRCYLPTAPNYSWYGGRGITVCDRWRFGEDSMSGFECFLADMGPRPDGLTLERKRWSQGYSPANCCWATWEEQQNNRSSNVFLRYDGAEKTIAEWARFVGINASAISERIERGWTVGQALELEPRPSGPGRRPSRQSSRRAA